MLHQIPLEVRLLVVFLLGAAVATQLNRAIYRLAYHPRAIGPWSPPHPDAAPRRWPDRLPIIGWLWLRREAPRHGRGYWVRPLLIELCSGFGLAAFYAWMMRGGLLPAEARQIAEAGAAAHSQFLAHAVLFALMLVATFIDLDEQTIPDEVTIPGTLLGLLLAATLPPSALPDVRAFPVAAWEAPGAPAVVWRVAGLQLCSPQPWPGWLNGLQGLWIGWACFLGWCYAIAPKTWWTRRGLFPALRYLVVSMWRHPGSRWIAALACAGCSGITLAWWLGPPRWPALLSALVGMAVGGGLIWAVRVIAGSVLGREAMGFGDVTLMAMIGAFLGWQSSLIVFFLAPFAGVVIAVAQWLITGRKDIAYGPFLCAAALLLVLAWPQIWDGWGRPVFGMGWFIPALLLVCLGLMGGLLAIGRFLSSRLSG
jgi:prepilin signal peptidase PulO-like enzyme (type II secretory pathway)